MQAITPKEAIVRIQKAIERVSSDPRDLPSALTDEGFFLIEVYELLCKYGYDF